MMGFPSRAILLISVFKSILISFDSINVPPGIINASNSSEAFKPSTSPFSFTMSVGKFPKSSNPGTAPLT